MLTWLADVARGTGYPVDEVDGWKTRGADTMNTPSGALDHHTAGAATGDMPSLYVLLNGNSTTPPPLSHYGVGRSGTIYVVAAGKCNHAGLGSWPGIGSSADLIGIENEHTGKTTDPWPEAQLDAKRHLVAAIARHLGKTKVGDVTDADTFLLLGHKEYAANPPGWPGRKIDPITLDMDDERALMDAMMQEDDDVTVEELTAVLNEVVPGLVAAELAKTYAKDATGTSQHSRDTLQHKGILPDKLQRMLIAIHDAVVTE